MNTPLDYKQYDTFILRPFAMSSKKCVRCRLVHLRHNLSCVTHRWRYQKSANKNSYVVRIEHLQMQTLIIIKIIRSSSAFHGISANQSIDVSIGISLRLNRNVLLLYIAYCTYIWIGTHWAWNVYKRSIFSIQSGTS